MNLITAKWTLDEYHRMIEAGILSDRRVELLKGEIVEMPSEGMPHAYFSTTAGNYLVRLLGERAEVRQGKPITLPNDSEPEPDIAIVQALGREYLNHHPYPENVFWLIEYADSSIAQDMEVKSRIYAEVGIAEYWVVNLRKRHIVVFRDPQDGEYGTKLTVSDGELRPMAFPEIQVAIAQIIST